MNTQQIITNYHNAWTSADMKAARAYLAEDLDFQRSSGASPVEKHNRIPPRVETRPDRPWFGFL